MATDAIVYCGLPHITAAHSSLLDAPGDEDDQHDQLFGAYDEENMTDTIPLETTLMVHRGHALEDLIANV